jgi:fructose-bisphosphate aldolase class I
MSMQTQEMTRTVAELTAAHKGILAADESVGTIEKRFKAVNVPSTSSVAK